MEKTNKNIVNAVINSVNNAASKAASKEEAKAEVKAEVKAEAKPKKEEKTAEDIQKEIKQRTEELQKCLQELQRKQKLSEHRTLFLTVLDQLEDSEKRVNEEEGFDSKTVKVKFIDFANYRDTEIFSIGNKSIILDFITFTREKIKARIQEIEKQLVG